MKDDSIAILPAQVAEASRLTEICRAAKQYWGYSDEWMAVWQEDLTVTPEYIEKQPVGVLRVRGQMAGFYGLLYDERGAGLEHLWVHPPFIGQGHGRRLFEAATDRARADRVMRLRIKADPNAESFYLRMGATREFVESYLLPGGVQRVVPILSYRV